MFTDDEILQEKFRFSVIWGNPLMATGFLEQIGPDLRNIDRFGM
jgi:hypothetical protein